MYFLFINSHTKGFIQVLYSSRVKVALYKINRTYNSNFDET